jgi:hypothetical protein
MIFMPKKMNYSRRDCLFLNLFIQMIQAHATKGKMAIARTLAMIFLPGLAVQKVKAELTF